MPSIYKKKRHELNALRFEQWLTDHNISYDAHGRDSRYVNVTVPTGWDKNIAGEWYVSPDEVSVRFSDHPQPPGGGYSVERGWRHGDSDILLHPGSKTTPADLRKRIVQAYKRFGLWKRGHAVPENEWDNVATGRPRENNYRVPNPACGGTKPVELITDRAKRYRANHPDCRPPGPRRCHLCGSRKNVDVHHLDGNEDHGAPENLIFACRRCNAAIGAAYAKRGIGKRTRQFNGKKSGARRVPSFREYVAAVASHRRGAWDAGGKVIHAKPPDVRQKYAERIWELRRQRGTDSQIPF